MKIQFIVLENSSLNPFPYLMIGIILFFLFGSVAYGMYSTFGPGSKVLTDGMDEHARMHELGIAHRHDWLQCIIWTFNI